MVAKFKVNGAASWAKAEPKASRLSQVSFVSCFRSVLMKRCGHERLLRKLHLLFFTFLSPGAISWWSRDRVASAIVTEQACIVDGKRVWDG